MAKGSSLADSIRPGMVVGAGPLIRAMAERIGVAPTIDGMVGWEAPGWRRALLVNRLTDRDPRYQVWEAVDLTDVPWLLGAGLTAADLTDDARGRALDQLAAAGVGAAFRATPPRWWPCTTTVAPVTVTDKRSHPAPPPTVYRVQVTWGPAMRRPCRRNWRGAVRWCSSPRCPRPAMPPPPSSATTRARPGGSKAALPEAPGLRGGGLSAAPGAHCSPRLRHAAGAVGVQRHRTPGPAIPRAPSDVLSRTGDPSHGPAHCAPVPGDSGPLARRRPPLPGGSRGASPGAPRHSAGAGLLRGHLHDRTGARRPGLKNCGPRPRDVRKVS